MSHLLPSACLHSSVQKNDAHPHDTRRTIGLIRSYSRASFIVLEMDHALGFTSSGSLLPLSGSFAQSLNVHRVARRLPSPSWEPFPLAHDRPLRDCECFGSREEPGKLLFQQRPGPQSHAVL